MQQNPRYLVYKPCSLYGKPLIVGRIYEMPRAVAGTFTHRELIPVTDGQYHESKVIKVEVPEPEVVPEPTLEPEPAPEDGDSTPEYSQTIRDYATKDLPYGSFPTSD